MTEVAGQLQTHAMQIPEIIDLESDWIPKPFLDVDKKIFSLLPGLKPRYTLYNAL
jgi:hypothetical protein